MEKSSTSEYIKKNCYHCHSTDFICTQQGFCVCLNCATESTEINIGISDQKIRDQTQPGYWNNPSARRNKITYFERIAYITQSEDVKYHNRLHKRACEEIHRICSALDIPYGIHLDLITEFENYYPIICGTFKKKTYPRHISIIIPILIYRISKNRFIGRISINEIYETMECKAKEFNSVLSRTHYIFSKKKVVLKYWF